MTDLQAGDLRTVLSIAAELVVVQNTAQLATVALPLLLNAVGGDLATYNEVEWTRRNERIECIPHGALDWDGFDRYRRYMHQSPLVRHFVSSHDERPAKTSDFMSRTAYHRTDLYNAYFKGCGVEAQIGLGVRITNDTLFGFSVCRSSGDFDERDRAILESVRPHLASAWQRAADCERLEGARKALRELTTRTDLGVLVLDSRQRVAFADGPVVETLAQCVGPIVEGSALPAPLAAGVRSSRGTGRSAETSIECGDSTVRLTAMSADHAGGDPSDTLVVLEHVDRPQALVTVLTRREREVLGLVAEGISNLAIARRLGISPRTVQKHVEHIFQRLGVDSRTAAAREFLHASRRPQTHDPAELAP